mgnify:CR=1 FL=1
MTNEDARKILMAEDWVGLTMFGEARGDSRVDGSSLEERVAVGCVIRNRLKTPGRFGDSYQTVCLKRKQFSCWNENDPNSALLWTHARNIAAALKVDDPLLQETLFLANGIVSNILRDITNGATSYYAPRSMVPPGRVPDWAIGHEPCARIGTQLFFKGV